MDRFYEDLAKASYKNARRILADANLLFSQRRYPSAYALAVLSAEEFGKAFLCKSCSTGNVSKNTVRKAFKEHYPKQFSFVRVITSMYLSYRFLLPAIQAEAEAIKKVKFEDRRLPFEEIDPSKAMHVIFSLTNAAKRKTQAIYVDTRRKKILGPEVIISRDRCDELLTILNEFTAGFEIALKEDDRVFTFEFNLIGNVFALVESYLQEITRGKPVA